MTLLLLLLAAVSACEEQPLFDTPAREAPATDRNTPQPSAPPDSVDTGPDVYVTAIVFPDSVKWRNGDTRGGKLVLFKNEKALGSLPAGDRADAPWHCYMDSHLWTYGEDEGGTSVYCDGALAFSFPDRESLVGFLVMEGAVHTLGQKAGGGFTYRIDGQEVYSSPTGTVLGSSARPEREGGALFRDGADVWYAYALPVNSGSDEFLWEYRVMRGAQILKTIAAIAGVQLCDLFVHQGEVYRLEYRYGRVCFLKGENLIPLELPEGSQSLHLTVLDGEVVVKGCHYDGWDAYYWIRDAESVRFQYYARWRYLYNIFADDGEMAAIVLDLDNCVVKVVLGEMEVDLNFETHRLHTPRCVDYKKGTIALALTGDVDYDENILLINDRKVPVPFNGYFTGIYIQ